MAITMKADEMRRMYVKFFEERGHKEIASASIIPENDPSVLFTTAGMHPLVPYLLGERHPMGGRLVSVQKCIRTDDIEEVGDGFHHTFFEMLGNWSLNDYFKAESIEMSFAFLTETVGIPAERLAVTVFEGDGRIPRDDEAYKCWINAGLRDDQIYFYGMKENWWGPAGETGPCGPDTEIFFDTGAALCGDGCGPACGCGKFVEIWNNVFMQYNKLPDGSFALLDRVNVDTGMGLERILALMNRQNDDYQTDLFAPIMHTIEELVSSGGADAPVCPRDIVSSVGADAPDRPRTVVSSGGADAPARPRTPGHTPFGVRERRIIADHIRAATFILGDNKKIGPSNTGQGYILRRLIRRAIRLLKLAGAADDALPRLAETVIGANAGVYPELQENREYILKGLEMEYALFGKVLDGGLKAAEKALSALPSGEWLDGAAAFRLFDTFGFPLEFTEELAAEKGVRVDTEGFKRRLSEHQETSRSGARGLFKGGLADASEQSARLHTATHLLNGALRKVLGGGVSQRGSNINAERLRFDFSFERKLTEGELRAVSDIVNRAIEEKLDVRCEEATFEAAVASGAVGVFEKKYGEIVKVYSIGGYSKEVCGGPHAGNTGELRSFTILREESSSAGVRRIKAVIG